MDSLSLLNAVEIIVGGAVGGTATVTFLSQYLGEAWLGRVLEKEKDKYTKEVENLKAGFAKDLEHYRAQLDRSIFVTRTHFETEFGAYKAVFEKLAEMRIQLGELRPSMNLVPANDTKEAKRERLSRAVEKAGYELHRSQLLRRQPFGSCRHFLALKRMESLL